ncbi:MAG: ribosome maturation factor RimP [Candidatus Omnitrophota bacterium]|nr:MAG: ribosome maturation factor RimP [Candidatus Omnitrophota bacterium]
MDISLSGSKHKPILRILVDKEGGIALDECTDINRQLSDILDKDDIIKESFILEVSSPGLDRPLTEKKDFEKVIGKEINLCTKEPIEGENFFQAMLGSVGEDFISLKLNGTQLKIPYENIRNAKICITMQRKLRK